MTPVFADATTTIAWLALVLALGGWAIYAFFNIRSSRAEIGSEIQLAANRKPYYDDEALEGKKLERTQMLGLAFLAVVTVALPLYWILEPGRQAGAEEDFVHKFESWGSGLFAATADGGFNCAGCHGGMKGGGGVASYAVTDPKTGEVKAVNWKAPAINNVYLRYTEEEFRFILNYGRPFSPMSAWGLVGGGPMNEQQIQTVLDYVKSIQIPRENCVSPDDDPKTCEGGTLPKKVQDEIQAEAERLVKTGAYASIGEALFNIDLVGAGSYSCARCHTKGWSYGEPQITGGGAFGPNLTGGSAVRQFPNQEDMIAFIGAGSEYGKRYGEQGQGGGRMPGFGAVFTQEQLRTVVEYVRGL